ncbi:5-methyltetrahydropteroyltriglutamate--homocysteine methyltransferase [Halococcus salifodinae DSM 8989]|uniref:5-methyltetrahydropteroyltriglutamate--homocysteine methyltransferase n=1 Tax=Halococcus salifodinae DSM 8989 TaxID=1227456 RepID=M0N822_9EURY|nr:5-methyltetrahydropteroyltriglutamate--homocysteine methyltransferase [Halococcus salifodinae DSM 8989]
MATTPGVFPLPDWAKDRLGSLKGHQKEDLIDGEETGEIADAYDEARAEVADWQATAGLDRVVEGQLRWDDMLAHPLCVHDAVETRGIVRYYDNNNFYREPAVTGELTFDGDLADDLDHFAALDGVSESRQAVVPGPYTLSDLATDEFYGDRAAFLDATAEFLTGEIRAFPDCETLFVLEPSLVTNPPADGLDERASDAIDRVAGATDADVVVQTYWGALEEKVHAHLLDADIDAVGYDFVTNHEENLYNINEYGTKESIALGLADGQNTKIEDGETITERIEWVTENVPAAEFETVYATTNTELFYLPVNKAKAKLAALAEGAALAGADADEEVNA